MPDYRIRHITRYTYPEPVRDSANQIMLFPVNDVAQQVKKHELHITGYPGIEEFIDYYGNKIGIFTILDPHTELRIDSLLEVTTRPMGSSLPPGTPAEEWAQVDELSESFHLMDFMFKEPIGFDHELDQILKNFDLRSKRPIDAAQILSKFVYEHFTYRQGVTSVETSADEVWTLKAGVCQDFAHVLLVMLRHAGIPARYVSGYVCPKNHDMRGEGATHAWAEAHLPGYGWTGIDPTNNSLVSDRHVRLAVGRHFADCTPVKGTYNGSGEHTLEVSVMIENGELAPQTAPVFAYAVRKTEPSSNSYRKFIEAQQQQ
jgi:transglutaminase-like putative cysteine protease